MRQHVKSNQCKEGESKEGSDLLLQIQVIHEVSQKNGKWPEQTVETLRIEQT